MNFLIFHSKTNYSENRIDFYDNLRFLLILLVVIGHFADTYTTHSALCRSIYVWIYSFHMPLFLFLSGLFYKNRNITKKILVYISIGFLYKIFYFLEMSVMYGNATFSLLSDGGIPWYMFVLAIYTAISYLLRKNNKRFILILSVILGCFVWYDSNIGDYLYLSRAIVFYPFFVLGEIFDKEKLLQITYNKRLKIIGFIILLIWGGLCLLQLDYIYLLRPLFTGRNPFSVNELFIKWGFAYRILCYLITFIVGTSVTCIITDRHLPIITLIGSRTLQIYFWHWFIAAILIKLQIDTILCMTNVGKLIWLFFVVILTFFLGFKVFNFPTNIIIKSCKYIESK